MRDGEIWVYGALFGVEDAEVVSGFGETSKFEFREREGEEGKRPLLSSAPLEEDLKLLTSPLDTADASDELNLILRLRMVLVLRVFVYICIPSVSLEVSQSKEIKGGHRTFSFKPYHEA